VSAKEGDVLRRVLVGAAVHLLLVSAAFGGLVDGVGDVPDWGITPFSRVNQSDTFDGTYWLTIENDYSPIDYPGGVGHQPSPGGTTGETFDLEEMYVRVAASRTQILLVAGAGPSVDLVGSTWYLGDLMIQAGGQQFAIVTYSGSQGLPTGNIYRISGEADLVGLQDRPRSYHGSTAVVENDYGPDATIPQIAEPWAVSGAIDPGQCLGVAAIETDSFDYGGKEDGTFLIQYTFDTRVLGVDEPTDLTTHITWGCGNDVIRVKGVESPYIPEPATVAMLLVGSLVTLIARRREMPKS